MRVGWAVADAGAYTNCRRWILRSDKMQTDLVTTKKMYSSLGQTKLEPKELVKERIGRSPDGGDALALTFAYPICNDVEEDEDDYNGPTGGNATTGY